MATNKIMTVIGSDGTVTIDHNGIIINSKPHNPNSECTPYSDILMFNIEEYKDHYSTLKNTYDICDLGYWTKLGNYEPPIKDFRDTVNTTQNFISDAVTGEKHVLEVTYDTHGCSIKFDNNDIGVVDLSNGIISCYKVDDNGEAMNPGLIMRPIHDT